MDAKLAGLNRHRTLLTRVISLVLLCSPYFAPDRAFAQATADTIGLADACVKLREHVLEFAGEEIYPGMLAIRSSFDRRLSDSDRTVLEGIRSDWHSVLLALASKETELASLRTEEDHEAIAENRRTVRARLRETRELRWKLKELFDRNPAATDKAQDELRSSAGRWQGGAMKYFVEWNAEHRPIIEAAMQTDAVTPLSDFLRGAMNFHFGQPIDDELSRFILWDGSDFIREMKGQRSLTAGHPLILPFDEARLQLIRGVYPDPFAETALVQIALPDSGLLRVSLLDENGKLASELSNAAVPAGELRLSIDGKALGKGRYFIELECGKLYDLVPAMHGSE